MRRVRRKPQKFTSQTDMFAALWPDIPRKQKLVFRALQRSCRGLNRVFKKYQTIAREAGCSVRTVGTAIRKFEELGWLALYRKPRRSHEYFMVGWLINLDIDDPCLWRRKQPVSTGENDPICLRYCQPSKEKEDKENVRGVQPIKAISREEEIPWCLRDLGLGREDQLKLSRYKSLSIIYAVETYKSYKTRNIVYNPAAFLTSMAKQHDRQGVRLC